MDNKIGIKIKELRINKELTQTELGLLLKVKKQTISKWELGINIPSIYDLITLSDIFQCSIDYIVKE